MMNYCTACDFQTDNDDTMGAHIDMHASLRKPEGKKTLEQMLVELTQAPATAIANDCERDIELTYDADRDRWRIIVACSSGNSYTSKHYDANTPMGAVVQAYRDR